MKTATPVRAVLEQALRWEIMPEPGDMGGEFYFHLRARNGAIMMQSGAYPSRQHCRRAINALGRAILTCPPVVLVD